MMSVRSWPGAAHEGQALLVLVGSRGLAHEHQAGLRVALAEHDVLAAAGELAPLAVAEILADGRASARARPAARRAERP